MESEQEEGKAMIQVHCTVRFVVVRYLAPLAEKGEFVRAELDLPERSNNLECRYMETVISKHVIELRCDDLEVITEQDGIPYYILYLNLMGGTAHTSAMPGLFLWRVRT